MKTKLWGLIAGGFGVLLACSSGGGGNGGSGGGNGGSAGAGGSSGSGNSAAVDPSFEDPGGDAPLLELPPDVTQSAQSIVDAADLEAAIAAMHPVLARSGVAVHGNGAVVVTPSEPAASAHVELGASADLALEARQRKTLSTMTATQIAELLAASGWPVPEAETPSRHFMKLLADLTAGALEDPADPSSFPILMIAANNQLQTPRANLALADQDPDLVRFSLLDLELLAAAFDRVSTSTNFMAGETGPCASVKGAMGNWGKPAKIALSEGHGQLVKNKLGSDASTALSSLKIAAKLWKLLQMFRYGTLEVTIDTENPTKKPRPSEGQKHGTVTAHAGVDQKTYDDYVSWLGKNGSSFINDVNVCFDYLGFPTKTDITDVAKDTANWRVSWTIVKGGGTEVMYKEGQEYKFSSRRENPLTSVSATEAVNSIEYRILPQLADIDHGNERRRHAVFSAQLRRGKPLDPGSIWSAGKGGFKAGNLSTVSAVLGLSSAAVDLLANWLLEVGSPTRYATQELIEIVPKGWVGTVLLSEEGSGGEALQSGEYPHAHWSGWSGKVKFESRATLGGSDSQYAKPEAASGFGRVTASCEVDYKEWSGGNNCYEGCPSTVPPDPDDVVEKKIAGRWGTTGTFGDGVTVASVQMFAYPAEMFGPGIDYLPPEMKAKVGTYELMIALPGCGATQAVSTTFSSTYDEGVKGPVATAVPLTHAWVAPFPALPGNPPQQTLHYVDKLPQGVEPTTLEKDLFVPREVTIPGTNRKIKSFLRLQIRLRREP